jgi:hypothetical protein
MIMATPVPSLGNGHSYTDIPGEDMAFSVEEAEGEEME